MNRILILPDIASAITEATGIAPEKSLAFVKELFAEAASRLTSGEQAKIDEIGTFSVDPLTGEILFTPDPALAAEINAPFAVFEPVEIISSELDLAEGQTEPAYVPTPEPISVAEPVVDPTPAPSSEPEPDIEPAPATEPEPEVAPEPEPTAEHVAEPIAEPTYYEPTAALQIPAPQPRRGNCCRALNAVLVGLAIVAAYLLGLYTPEIRIWLHRITAPAEEKAPQPEIVIIEREPEADATPTAVSETTEPAVAVEPVAPAEPKEHLDTVRVKYYITHMAKRYYGNDNFWSYIYKENEQRLGHPDLTQPGTVVVIPPAEKYGINASDPASVAAAKQLGGEIYRKFRN